MLLLLYSCCIPCWNLLCAMVLPDGLMIMTSTTPHDFGQLRHRTLFSTIQNLSVDIVTGYAAFPPSGSDNTSHILTHNTAPHQFESIYSAEMFLGMNRIHRVQSQIWSHHWASINNYCGEVTTASTLLAFWKSLKTWLCCLV